MSETRSGSRHGAHPDRGLSMRLAHFFARSPNLGDRGSAVGIQTVLRSIRGDIEFTEFDIDAGRVGWREARRLARDFDGLIVGGGGLLYNRPSHASKFYLNIPFDRFRGLNLPRCFMGVGLNSEYSGQGRWAMTEATRESIRLFMRSADLVGVRDVETLSFLGEMGVEGVSLTPCPSMFLLYGLEAAKRENNLAINVTKRTVGLAGVEMLLNHLKAYARKEGLRPVVVGHHPDEDKDCLALAAGMGMDTFMPVTPENLMEFYKRQFVLVGMRGHSLIYATGADLPVLAVSYNVKCDAHMAMLRMEDFVVRCDDLARREALFDGLDRLLSRREEVASRLAAKKVEFHELAVDFARRWIALVHSRQGA
jgi:polysaccharide pyruvyl transferase WcaK-like protein